MNLHRLVAPATPLRPPPEIVSVDSTTSVLTVTFYQYNEQYDLDSYGRIRRNAGGPGIITGYQRNRWPTTLCSTRTRSNPWICRNNVVHQRYWTTGPRAGRYSARQCEHTIGISPITGQLAN